MKQVATWLPIKAYWADTVWSRRPGLYVSMFGSNRRILPLPRKQAI
jgi:hypothetical protein